MAEKTIEPIVAQTIKTIDFIFNEYEPIFSDTGLIDINIPHYLDPEQRNDIKKYYEEKNNFIRVEPMIIKDPEETTKSGRWRSTTSFKFRKNN